MDNMNGLAELVRCFIWVPLVLMTLALLVTCSSQKERRRGGRREPTAAASIEFDNPDAVFVSGLEVSGTVIVQAGEPLEAARVLVNIRGSVSAETTRWQYMGGDYHNYQRLDYAAAHPYADETVCVWPPPSECGDAAAPLALTPGTHRFPFRFNLPQDCPPSFYSAIPGRDHGSGTIQYHAEAAIDGPGWSHRIAKKFSVIPTSNLNFVPDANSATELGVVKDVGVLKGEAINMTVQMPKRGFVPGEVITATVKVDNNSSKRYSNLTLVLVQQYVYSTKRWNYIMKTPMLDMMMDDRPACVTTKPVEIGEGESRVWTLALPIPPIVATFDCPIVAVDYFVVVVLSNVGRSSTDVKARIPVIIGTIPAPSSTDDESPASLFTYPPCSFGMGSNDGFIPRCVYYPNLAAALPMPVDKQ